MKNMQVCKYRKGIVPQSATCCPLYLSCLLCANYCLLCALSTFSFALFFSIFYMFFYIPFFFISLASFVPIIGYSARSLYFFFFFPSSLSVCIFYIFNVFYLIPFKSFLVLFLPNIVNSVSFLHFISEFF